MPLVNRLYMVKEIPRVSPVPRVFIACGTKLRVVSVAAT
jgi:hypothetical protein